MKVGIIGAGAVGTSCANAMLLRGSCDELVLLDTKAKRVKGVATDLSHGEVLCPPTRIRAGGYEDLRGAKIIVITAGINERSKKNAIDRKDPRGRLLLLPDNTKIYEKIIPELVRVAPRSTILVVTDPPDPLADVTRALVHEFKGSNRVISAGTFLDTLRFQLQIARHLKCHPSSVDAIVLGEHGTSQVYAWSSARVGGEAVLDQVRKNGGNVSKFQKQVERDVKFANIAIIRGTGASQHGIGIVTARLVEAMLRDEGLVAPVGVFQKQFSVTLSLPAVINRNGVSKVLTPALSIEESEALANSGAAIGAALNRLKGWSTGKYGKLAKGRIVARLAKRKRRKPPASKTRSYRHRN